MKRSWCLFLIMMGLGSTSYGEAAPFRRYEVQAQEQAGENVWTILIVRKNGEAVQYAWNGEGEVRIASFWFAGLQEKSQMVLNRLLNVTFKKLLERKGVGTVLGNAVLFFLLWDDVLMGFDRPIEPLEKWDIKKLGIEEAEYAHLKRDLVNLKALLGLSLTPKDVSGLTRQLSLFVGLFEPIKAWIEQKAEGVAANLKKLHTQDVANKGRLEEVARLYDVFSAYERLMMDFFGKISERIGQEERQLLNWEELEALWFLMGEVEEEMLASAF